MKKIQQYRIMLPGVILVLLLTGCATLTEKDAAPDSVLMTKPLKVDLKPDFRSALEMPESLVPPPVVNQPSKQKPERPVAATEKQSSCGNEPAYTLNGRSYKVLPSASGYREEGMATRYSAKYQGSATAGCEKYDLHAFTAAHRTLPLPSFVRVTNLQNNKSLIVKVNDRGPFDGSGLIRVSSAVYSTLGMNELGEKGRVRVEAVKTGGNIIKAASAPVKKPVVKPKPQTAQQAGSNIRRSVAAARRALVKQPTPAQAAAIKRAKQSGKSFFVVVKNYDSQMDALDLFVRLTSVGLIKTELASAKSQGRNVHQVRVGPLYTQDQIDSVKDTLSSNGLATFKVVEIDQ